MRRWRRILVELLGPPPVATTLLALFAIAHEPGGPWTLDHLGGLLAILAFAYLLAAIPCVISTLVLEIAFARGLPPGSGRAVLLAAGLGLLSGVAMAGFGASSAALEWMPALGAATGLALGAFVRWRSMCARPLPAGAERGRAGPR